MDNQKIGAFITERRKAKNLTQKELADQISVTVQTISKWECGKGLPDISLMKSLCEVLDITINDLLNGEKIAEKDLPKYAEKQIADIMLYNQDASKYEAAMGIFWGFFVRG
jgi:transcriptional regulator with XRE-family HTH domain